jgi:flagellar motor component MotA
VDWNNSLITLPDCIGDLKGLLTLNICRSSIEKLPDSIGNLESLTTLTLDNNKNLKTLPDSIGNLKNLNKLDLKYLPIKDLPDSIGNLKNLIGLDLNKSPVEKLPDTIVNCTALEFVDIRETRIYSVPEFISSIKIFKDNLSTELIPQGHSISYRCFCNCYYRLAETILNLTEKARKEGLLALEEEFEDLPGEFIKKGMRLVVDGADSEVIRRLMLTELEREHDFYRRNLMKVAMEGVLSIQAGANPVILSFLLAHLVNIENNPLEAACEKYFAGDFEAFSSIDFKAAIQPEEEEREEVRFAKRAFSLIKIQRKEGLWALEKHLDQDGIAAKDVFEYGLQFVIDDWNFGIIGKILDGLIEREIDPVRKNFAMAKKEAVRSICNDDNPRILLVNLSAFFDEDISRDIMDLLED